MTAGGPGPGRRRALLAAHLLVAGLLAISAALLAMQGFGAPDDAVNLAPLVIGELILLGVAAGVVLLFDRYGPMLLVDVLVAAPLAAILFTTTGEGLPVLLSLGLVGVAVVASILAALEVRRRQIERIGIAIALLGLAIALLGAPAVAAVVILVLLVLISPEPPASWSLTGSRRSARTGVLGRAGRGPDGSGSSRPERVGRSSGGAPDAAAVLGRRAVDRDEPG